jgi:hypothetical protein
VNIYSTGPDTRAYGVMPRAPAAGIPLAPLRIAGIAPGSRWHLSETSAASVQHHRPGYALRSATPVEECFESRLKALDSPIPAYPEKEFYHKSSVFHF